jgi:Domain of unknown function (DUF4145)
MASAKCPHCGVTIAWVTTRGDYVVGDETGTLRYEALTCPECKKAIVQLIHSASGTTAEQPWTETRMIAWPRASNRTPAPPQVPDAIRQDYVEACLVLIDSPKASAALSRRCLQHILRDAAKVKPGNLAAEIDQAIAARLLPTSLNESLDAVREIGNFAAHPTKSQHSGEVIEVEPGEAEWNLDVVEALMDVLYVQPAALTAKRAALNAKLADAGKNPV